MKCRYTFSIAFILAFLCLFSVDAQVLLEKEWRFITLTPGNLTGAKAINFLPYVGGNNNDDFRISAGSPSLNSVVAAENWNGNQLTILMWVKLPFVPGDGATHQLLANNVGGGSNNISVFIFTDGTLYYDVTDKDVLLHRFSSSVTGWSVGTWHQVVVRLDFKNDEGELYVDGVSVDSTPTNAFSSDSMDTIAVTNLGQDSAQANQLNGQISILAESRSWSDAEITADYAAGAGTPRVVGPYTILYDQFSDSSTGITFHPSGQGVTATDSGGNVTLDVTDAEKLYKVGEAANLEDATGFSASGPVLIESASGADVTVGSGIAHADLNGSSQFFSVSDAAFPATGLTGAQDLSIEAWIYLGDVSGAKSIASKYDTTGANRMYTLNVFDDELRFVPSSDGNAASARTSTNANFAINIWYHVAVTYDASDGSCIFYKNGVALTDDGTAIATSIANKTPDFTIGRLGNASNYFSGKIGPTHLFSAIKTPAEIYTASKNMYYDHSADGDLVWGALFTEAAAAAAIDNVEGTAAGDIIPQDSGAVIYSGLRSTEGSYVQDVERVGTSLDFDGSEFVNAGNDASVNFGATSFSVLVWSKTSTDYSGEQGSILTKGAGGPLQKRYTFFYDTDNKVRFNLDDNTIIKNTVSDTALNDGKWHISLGVRDGNTLRLYVDGIQNDTTDITGYGDVDDNEPFVVGASNTSGGIGNTQRMTGQVDAVMAFSVPLTAADALWLATHPGADEAEIVANTSVNLGEMVLHHDYRSKNLVDVSSDGAGNLNGNDGTHSGTPSYVTSGHLTRNLLTDIENGNIGNWAIVGTPTLVDKESDTDSDSLSLHIVAAADNDGVSQVIPAENGDKFYLSQRHKVSNGSFEVNVTNGGGGIETGISDASWTQLEKIISATGNLTFQWLGEAAADDWNISKATVIKCVAGDSLTAGLYYTRVFNVDTSNVGAEWSGLGADATEVQAGDLYVRNDTRDASTATKGDGLVPINQPFFPAEWQ